MRKVLSRRKFLSNVGCSTAATVLARPALSFAHMKPFTGFFDVSAGTALSWQDQGVINTANSPYAKLHSVPVRAVTIEEGFWSKRCRTNVERSIPSMHDELEEHGRMDNFRRLAGKSSAPQKGPYFSDSDIYKWTDAVGWALQSDALPQLRRTTESMIREVVAAQEPNGYLNTYYQNDRISLRMSQHDQEVGHEMYCLGHMLQGAIAHYCGTGDSTLMDAGARMVDNFVMPNYGPGPNQKQIVSGHPEIEMALIELYRTTGKHQCVDLAAYILHGDDRWTIEPERIVYMFCGIPFTQRTKLEGHAVRAMYACSGAADYYLETGDQAYWKFSLAYFGQQSWSTLVMVLPTDLFPRNVVGAVAGLVGFGGAMGGIAFGQLVGYLLDHGFGYGPVFTIAGSLHVAAFLVILAAIPVIAPLGINSKLRYEASL